MADDVDLRIVAEHCLANVVRFLGQANSVDFAAVRPDACVLYMTGYAEVPLVSEAVIVHKPFSVLVLMDAVRRALEGATRTEYAIAPSDVRVPRVLTLTAARSIVAPTS